MTEGNSRVRLSVIGVVVMVLFSTLFVRLWFLQVATSQSYAAETRANRIRVISEPAIRGSILDENGKVIVGNELINSVQVRRGITDEQRKAMVPRLALVLGKSEKYVNLRLDSVRYSPYQPVPIANSVPYQKLVFLKERPELFPFVDVVRRSIRVYPDGAVAPHLLGYVGAINAQEQKLHADEGYGPEDVIGKDGVEAMFETQLRGKPRVRKLEVDSRGRLVRELSDTPAVAGNDVQLTVNVDVQKVAQESLEQGMKAAGGLRDSGDKSKFATFKATGGAAIVLDARDGSVVALASAPAFDVTKFTDGIPAEQFKALNDPASNYPLLNRTLQGQYAPASSWKVFTSIAALQAGTTTPDEVIYDKGFVEYGAPGNLQEFKNASKEPHFNVTLTSALSVSSDVYFYIQGFRMWKFFNEREEKPGGLAKGYAVQRVARSFNFGKATGIGLANEQVGRVPTQKFKERLNKNDPDPATRSWLPGDSAALAVGQGDLLVTPLQEAVAYAAFANGGTLYAPRLAKKILNPGQSSDLRELPPQKTGEVKIKPEIRAPIIEGLIGAASPGGNGTAGPAFSGYTGVPVAGKTGTGEVLGKQDTSVFAAIVNPDPTPDSDERQYVVIVFIEQGGNGGSVAAPVSRRIIEALNGNPAPPAVRVIAKKGD